MNPRLVVVLPVYNEEGILPELHRRLEAVLAKVDLPWQVIYVDDGSHDGSLAALRQFAERDPRVAVLALSRNFGHQAALTAGLDHARGEAIVLIDSDLQDPPELIPELVARWREGYDVVYAQRRARPGDSVFKRVTAWGFYRFMRSLANVDLPPDTGDFRLLSARAADAVRSLRERRRFLRGLVAWAGFRTVPVMFDRAARPGGESKYSMKAMVRLAITALLSFSSLPVAVIGLAGSLVCAGALLSPLLGASALGAGLFFLGGVQLLGLWIVGQYVAHIAEESHHRPLYFVGSATNIEARPHGER